jgi:hypothetical protein
MDRTYIESQHIVQRYLSGDLSVREAREFEKYCADNPDVLNSLPIPARVKAKMAHKPGDAVADFGSDMDALGMPSSSAVSAAGLDDQDDDDDDDDEPTSRWQGSSDGSRKWVMMLGFALLLAVGGIVALLMTSSATEKDLKTQLRAAKAIQLRPPGNVQTFRVTPAKSPGANPINVGNPDSAVLIDLFVNVSDGSYNTFLVTIDDVERGRVGQFRRMARDSNKELRLSLNSSAFGIGDFDIKLEGYTWRGDTVPVGWIRLGLK